MLSGKLNKEQQLFHSLVKYDTPYLISPTVNKKKSNRRTIPRYRKNK
jgi:hypothetical protein